MTRVRLAAALAGVAVLASACARAPAPEPVPPVATADTLPALVVLRPAEPPQPEPAPARPTVRPDPQVCAGGDVLLGNNLDTRWAERASRRLGRHVPAYPDADSLLAPLRQLIVDADVVLLNLEGAVGSGPAPSKCRPGSRRCYAFRQPIAAAEALSRWAAPASVVANVANNHAMDAGPSGFQATLRHLRAAGIHATGADTLATPVATASGDTIAFLGFSTFIAGPDARDLSGVRRHVSRAARRHHRLVVTVHMGAEGYGAQRTADGIERYLGEDRGNPVAFARTAVEAGAALVIGHGPHVLRAAEWRDAALILYSLGNLLTYGPFNLSGPSGLGAIACARIDDRGRVTGAVLRSTKQRPPGKVAPDRAARAAALVDSLSRLDFPSTGARVRGDSLRPPIAEEPATTGQSG